MIHSTVCSIYIIGLESSGDMNTYMYITLAIEFSRIHVMLSWMIIF